MRAAAEKGDIEALDWAQSQAPPFVMDETLCEASLNLNVMKWLRTRSPSCPWTNTHRVLAQRAYLIQTHLMLCGLQGEVPVIIRDIVRQLENA